MSRMFIHATNVHQGGGQTLLDAVLLAHPGSVEMLVLLDNRMPVPETMSENIQIKRVNPSVVERFKAEWWLAGNVRPIDVALCFGNLPPLFKLRGRAMVFLQNRYLIDDVRLGGFSLKIRARLAIERLWLLLKMTNVDEFIVQTPTMKRLLEIKTEGRVPVCVLPFMADTEGYVRSIEQVSMSKRGAGDFLYVASGEPHKNHLRLIHAWCLLADEGLFPALWLTLDDIRFPALCREIEALRQRYGLNVTNVGELSHVNVLDFYKKMDALIYPSNFESFGLPLIEARQAGLRVLAPELDYVRDVLDPEQSFDPESSISIARAVKRFLGIKDSPLPLQDAETFMRHFLGKEE